MTDVDHLETIAIDPESGNVHSVAPDSRRLGFVDSPHIKEGCSQSQSRKNTTNSKAPSNRCLAKNQVPKLLKVLEHWKMGRPSAQ
ncbi:hypothetical protein GALMADRAFT_622532 [Galerina marginata CBS 339.88]|uniref:Uncharacterized protein n=1 Tax=Galerina marginata (strain CBS 339.88) TaxID=685588 RepID=A0A067SRP0_GALM3|nr:hypothetical protein GALMADRAFT_622532 [Galerina marginata CBS 339.88]